MALLSTLLISVHLVYTWISSEIIRFPSSCLLPYSIEGLKNVAQNSQTTFFLPVFIIKLKQNEYTSAQEPYEGDGFMIGINTGMD